jgi:hypothetical protein
LHTLSMKFDKARSINCRSQPRQAKCTQPSPTLPAAKADLPYETWLHHHLRPQRRIIPTVLRASIRTSAEVSTRIRRLRRTEYGGDHACLCISPIGSHEFPRGSHPSE